ncbi:SixA phosphatase family protein [Robertkochia aurantiaca]|uniref:SixA phosphatase family protein n=1 Tax=Robertkochia aurantiaca TaxID=2873700 RepID=UPI001CC99E7A|nr:phosphoglycerate mutase family protein [Robertkochia sp. 3YJGBD-33]
MKNLAKLLVIVSAFTMLFSCEEGNEQNKFTPEKTTFFLVRHAEKDRSDPEEKDPALTDKGIKRAVKWSEILRDVKIDAVYATDYERTKSTAKPTADDQGVPVTIYDPDSLVFFDDFAAKKPGNYLVVGHSNTIPVLANHLTGTRKYSQIDDRNNGNLYIITIDKSGTQDLLLHCD